MDSQGNIISFDEARRIFSTQSDRGENAHLSNSFGAPPMRASSVPDSSSGNSTIFTPADVEDMPVFVSPFSRTRASSRSSSASDQSNSDTSRATGFSQSERRSPTVHVFPEKSSDVTENPQEEGSDGAQAGSRKSKRDKRVESSKSRRNEQIEPRESKRDVATDEVESQGSERDNQAESRESKRDEERRKRLKAKAKKMFARQFGKSAPSEETGSRAAVYKVVMGKNHKRACEEMAESTSGASSFTAGKARKPKKLRSLTASRIAVAAGCLVCVAAVVLFLYPTAQQVYLESREEDRLQAEYDALIERNTALQDSIDYLNTDEGIQDAAREELGWVQEGEIAVVVVKDSSEDSEDEETNINTKIVSGSIAAPETWYSPVLDVIFGYTDPTTTQDDEASAEEDSSDEASLDEENV